MKISIEVENNDEKAKDGFLSLVRSKYDYVFLKENTGYGSKKYFNYVLTPRDVKSIGRKRKLSPEEESEVRRMHFESGFTISELVSFYGVSKATVCRILKR